MQNYTNYYKLAGYINERAVYVRTSVLSARDQRNNKIREYNINTNNDKSLFSANLLNTGQLDMNLYTSIIENPNLVDIYEELEANDLNVNNVKNPVDNDC